MVKLFFDTRNRSVKSLTSESILAQIFITKLKKKKKKSRPEHILFQQHSCAISTCRPSLSAWELDAADPQGLAPGPAPALPAPREVQA